MMGELGQSAYKWRLLLLLISEGYLSHIEFYARLIITYYFWCFPRPNVANFVQYFFSLAKLIGIVFSEKHWRSSYLEIWE